MEAYLKQGIKTGVFIQLAKQAFENTASTCLQSNDTAYKEQYGRLYY